MRTNNRLTKILASLGALGVWFPLLAPVLFAWWGWLGSGRLNFDYLMPAELFPLALVATGLEGVRRLRELFGPPRVTG